ncbi:MAG: hypothetical protein AABX39_05610 [Nanoarchaeota archaeon]
MDEQNLKFYKRLYELETPIDKCMLRINSQEIGKYLSLKHLPDPDLWPKLKQLRILDDLKKLVEEK